MYLPKIYQDFIDHHPEIMAAYKNLGKQCRQAGPLDAKTQDLIKLGIAVGTNSKGAVMSHTRKALAAGASTAEIIHAILLAVTTIGFPAMMAALNWSQAVFAAQTSDTESNTDGAQ